MKTITSGTPITFIQTGDKFTLTQTETGFDVKQVKLSKNTPHEPYTFQELLDLYKEGQISIAGFEEADAPLVESILTNYIHGEQIGILKKEFAAITAERDELKTANDQFTLNQTTLTEANSGLTASNQTLTSANEKLKEEIVSLKFDNKELTVLNDQLKEQNAQLNTTIENMQEKE